MSLVKLIREHKLELTTPQASGYGLNLYHGFRAGLINLERFRYERTDVVESARTMTEFGFSGDAMQLVVAYAMRRAAVESITDSMVRGRIWRLLELSEENLMQTQKISSEAVKGYVLEFGEDGLKNYLLAVFEGLKGVLAESHAIKPEDFAQSEEALFTRLMECQIQAVAAEKTTLEALLTMLPRSTSSSSQLVH